MILVNVLPSEFRQKGLGSPSSLLNKKVLAVAGVFFLALTGIFYVLYWIDASRLPPLEAEWAKVQQQVERIEQIRAEMEEGVKAERTFLERHLLSPFPATAVLNWVSEFIPDGTWLTELRLTRQPAENGLILKGVAITSRTQSGVQRIEELLRRLKEKFPMDTRLVLTTSREQKDRREQTLFTVVFKWSIG